MSAARLNPAQLRAIAHEMLSLADQVEQLVGNSVSAKRAGHSKFGMEEVEIQLLNTARAEYLSRKARLKHIDNELLGEPAWDMLLDLFISTIERKKISVTSLCLASGVAPTTALRYINDLVDRRMIIRRDSIYDRRRTYLELSSAAFKSIGRALEERSSIFAGLRISSSEEDSLMLDAEDESVKMDDV